MRSSRIVLIAIATIVTATIGGSAWLVHRADNEPRYADVTSIANEPSYQDSALLQRAWALPVAALYRADGYEYQANPSFCGPTSAANVAQSLGRDLNQRSVLAGTSTSTFLGFAVRGLVPGVTLDQEADILRVATDRPVDVLRGLDIEEFRSHLRQTNDPAYRYVANFNRAPLWGSGHGHFSPILGYLETEDLVFVGDVNDDYAPFLVSAERLLQAMNTVDDATGQVRGLVRISPPPGREAATWSAVRRSV